MRRPLRLLATVLLCAATVALANIPGVGAQTTNDYDANDNGLIEIKTLEQLNAIRWDLDGSGEADDSANDDDYDDAFPNPETDMGCPNTGCIGYELTAALDFDTDDDGEADAGDDYWNGGNGWLPIGDDVNAPFNATFDGNRLHGHLISNLYINRPGTTGLGLFGYAGSSATIRNVKLLGVKLTGHNDAGGLVGSNDGGTISNINVSGTISGGHQVGGLAGINQSGGSIEDSQASGTVLGYRNAGGLVGANYDTISDSHASVAVTSEFPSTIEQAGGLAGLNQGGTISNSYATGTVEGNQDIGGLVGKNDFGTIEEDSYATGAVTGKDASTSTSERIGGLVGLNTSGSASISDGHATGKVEGHQDIGGLVGKNDLGSISDSYAEGDVTGRDANASTSERIGGLVGLSTGGSASISDSHATGTVKGHQDIGGLVGWNDGDIISDSYATGTVEGHTDVGGLVGWNTSGAEITDSYATTSGKVSGEQQVGGLVGLNNGTVIYSYATGRVEGRTDVGGLVGKNDDGSVAASYATGTVAAALGTGVGGLVGTNSGSGTVSATYATGRVEGRTDVGGLVGKNSGTITAGYAIGRVSGQADIGGLVGMNDGGGIISDSYWNTATAGVKVSVGSDDEDGNGEINGTETETTGASGKTTEELQTPTDYTDSDANTDDIYANWNLDLDNTGGADYPWYFGTASEYPVLKLNIDFNDDDTVDEEDWKTQQPPSPPSPPPAPKPSTSSTSSGDDDDDDDDSEEPDETAPPAEQPPLIGQSSSTSAYELDDNRVLLRIHNPDDPENPIGIEVGIGSINSAGTEIVPVGYVRDDSLGQTYAVLRREFDGKIVRRWVAPDSPLALIVPWDIVNSQYTFPVSVIVTIPLDERWPHPNQLARRFDGGDVRILSYDASLLQWRHVPDLATFQSLGFYWCDVTAADAGFFERINLGTPYPATSEPARSDYPSCRP